MAPGISIIPPLARRSNGSFSVDTAFSTFPASSPTPTIENLLAPRAGCTDSVVIEISTTVTIDHFRRYYDGPIDSFSPSYVALGDGSLVNPPLLDDIKAASVKLAVLSGLFIFFLINTFTATRYLYRGLVKNKILFYLLLFSQTFGLVAMTSMIVPFFDPSANCIVLVLQLRFPPQKAETHLELQSLLEHWSYRHTPCWYVLFYGAHNITVILTLCIFR